MSGPDTERRAHRKHVGSSGRLKTNKVTVRNDLKPKTQRPKKGDTDIVVESPEFKLLVRLYVPVKLLIRNNKVSRKQLSNHLPVIVNDALPDLDFELHIFLSSIVTSYVSSWYLAKLNTDNFEFIENVYGILCDFVKDFARRILAVVELDRLLEMIDDLAHILDSHIDLVSLENKIPAFVERYLSNSTSLVLDSEDLEQIVIRFLKDNHVIFDREACFVKTSQDSEVEADSMEEEKEDEEPRLSYLRVVVKNILLVTFPDDDDSPLAGQGPTSSAIAMNLVTLILADLVLEKVVTKLATPQFLLQTVMGKLANQLEMQLSARAKAPVENVLFYSKAKKIAKSVYINVSTVAASLSQKSQTSKHDSGPSLFYSPVLSLANTITNFSARKPVLYYALCIFRSGIMASANLSRRLEAFGKAFIINKIGHSALLQDSSLANIVQMLRSIVFENDVVRDTMEENTSPEELTNKLFAILQTQASSALPMGMSLLWFLFRDESEEQLRQAIFDFLSIFNYDGKADKNTYKETSLFNQLLVIRFLDTIVGNLYPELAECYMQVDNTIDGS